MAGDESRSESLVIYLAKKRFEKPSDTIEDLSSLDKIPVVDNNGKPLGDLYVQARGLNPPRWGRFFAPQVSPSKLGRVSSTAAVLHLVVDGRAFLVTFGQGRYLLASNCCEDRFGLLVTLNSIGENNVRSIDKSTLDTIGRHTRVQASREAPPSEFGFDIERDLLRAITGTPTDSSLGKRLSGLESLHAIARVDLFSLKSLLATYLEQSSKKSYKKTFPWIDHISEVKDPVLVGQLDALMIKAARKGKSDKCWLAVPEPIEWNAIAGFRYRRGSRHAIVHDISFDSFVEDSALNRQDLTIEILQRREIIAVDPNDIAKHRWSIYRSTYCEVDHFGGTYILSNAKWYSINSDFVSEVDKFFQGVPRYTVELPEFDDDTELAYCKRVAAANPDTYALMDQKLVLIGGGYSRIEFCDLLAKDKHLIHIKRYGGAGALSHLFSQGVVSGQLFVSAASFRKDVNQLLPPLHKIKDIQSRPDPTKYCVVFAIVSQEPGAELTLPFFSRLTTRQAVETLRGYGYTVMLAKIKVGEKRAKTKKYRAHTKSKKTA